MSVRPNIYVFDLIKFKKLFGSSDQKFVNTICRAYEKQLSIIDKDKQYWISRKEDFKLIREALMDGGEKVVLLETSHPEIFIDLIMLQPELIDTDSDGWRTNYLEYFQKIHRNSANPVLDLLDYFINGRSFFSDKPITLELPYMYLTNHEVKLILQDMNKSWKKYDDSDGFGKDFRGWLEKISLAGKDLLYFAN